MHVYVLLHEYEFKSVSSSIFEFSCALNCEAVHQNKKQQQQQLYFPFKLRFSVSNSRWRSSNPTVANRVYVCMCAYIFVLLKGV